MAELYQIQDSENSENFAHDSEKRIAELFDFYGVSWEYEPTTFILEEDEDGIHSLLSPQTSTFQTMICI